jgi:DivIVA domain-containing protein
MENEQANDPTNGPHMLPADIQRQEFGVSRFGGYRMRDVDEFLDRLTESTELLLAENERLRAGGSPIVGTSDLDDVNRQADEIVQRARDEAARIVAEARDQAPSGVTSPTAAGAAAPTQPPVDAFLGKERAFLQSLATLVQGHAESVKGMAREARRATAEGERTSAPAVSTASVERAAPSEVAEDQISLPEASDEPADPGATVPDVEADRDETVVLEVPQPTSARADRDRDSDPSLRKLFWGEDR